MLLCIKSITLSALVLLMLLFVAHTNARPYKDSPIRTIIVPYQPNAVGYPYQQFLPAIAQSRHVLVPQKMEMVPNFNLDKGAIAMGSKKGAAVNFADGAYPVYYMPSNVNGRFLNKISLLTNEMS